MRIEDKEIERQRYDLRALSARGQSLPSGEIESFKSLPMFHQPPYRRFEQQVSEHVRSGARVLEIGSGCGEFTWMPVKYGGKVVATDISGESLLNLRRRYHDQGARVEVVQADMEALPFDEREFDVVLSAGSLSYGDNGAVLTGIHRVTRPGGVFICVDTLNNNPIYRLNRWVRYVRGQRSRSTLKRMPTLSLIEQYRKRFGDLEVSFYGSVVWAMPAVSTLIGQHRASRLSSCVDRTIGVEASAFKFVMTAKRAV